MNNIKPLFDDLEPFSDDENLKVFSKEYLLERGYCCGNACLNCPYDYKNVPEPRRTNLIKLYEERNKSSEEK